MTSKLIFINSPGFVEFQLNMLVQEQTEQELLLHMADQSMQDLVELCFPYMADQSMQDLVELCFPYMAAHLQKDNMAQFVAEHFQGTHRHQVAVEHSLSVLLWLLEFDLVQV